MRRTERGRRTRSAQDMGEASPGNGRRGDASRRPKARRQHRTDSDASLAPPLLEFVEGAHEGAAVASKELEHELDLLTELGSATRVATARA